VKYENLSRGDQAIYNTAITHTHERRIRVHVQTLDGDPVTSLTPWIAPGGQVAHDVTNDASTAILTMQFADPTRSINFEPDTGGQSLHRKYLIQVVDSRRIVDPDNDVNDWIDTDVHTGPVWDFDRQGGLCSLTAHGIDRLAMGTVRHPMWWGRHRQKTDVIRELLGAAGADHLGGIPDLPATTGHRVTAGFSYEHHKVHHPAEHGHKAHNTRVTTRKPRTDTYIELADQIADSMNRHLLRHTAGRFILRRHPLHPALHVHRHLVAEPDVQRPGVDAPNLWILVGDNPKGPKPQVRAQLGLPEWHPLSAESLAWNGKPYVVEERIENPHVKRAAEARAIVRRHRDRGMRFVTDYEFDMLPVPWLQEYDIVRVHTELATFDMPLRQWSYPLGTPSTSGGTGAPMHVGGVRRAPAHRRPRVRGVA
jgi:hypothetical protein